MNFLHCSTDFIHAKYQNQSQVFLYYYPFATALPIEMDSNYSNATALMRSTRLPLTCVIFVQT